MVNPLDASEQPVLVVTGAHLESEVRDRPWAYWLRQRILEAMDAPDDGRVVVCSDLWVMNHPDLRACPTVCIGAPEFNALAAYLAGRLPSVLAVDGVYVVLMEAELDAPQVCCWGRDGAATGAAVEAFAARHLDEFLDATEA